MDTISLDSFFESSEIESDYLKSLLERVLSIINRPDLCFGKIYEGRIFGTPGNVTWDGDIYLDSKRLQQYDDQIAMAIPYKLASREVKDGNAIIRIGDLEIGGPKLIVMAGPCSIESEEQLMESAYIAKKGGVHILRGGPFSTVTVRQ